MNNNFPSIQNPNPQFPFMIPPVVIAPVIVPEIPGPVPMVVPVMKSLYQSQMPQNLQGFIHQNNANPYLQVYHNTLQPIHANFYRPPGNPAPVVSTSNRITSSAVFHSLVVRKLLRYIREKAKKDSAEIEVIDLVSDDEEEEEIIVVGSINPQDSGRYSGEPNDLQTNREKSEDESVDDELIVRDSSISSEESSEKPLPSISKIQTVKRQNRRVGEPKFQKYSKFYSLFTTAQWLKYRREQRWQAKMRERKRMEKTSGSVMDFEAGGGDN